MSEEILLNRHIFKQCSSIQTASSYQWVSNSCYLDTVLWVLFSSYTPFIDNKILFAQPTLEKLHNINFCEEEKNDWNEKIFYEFQMLFRKITHYFRCGVGQKECSSFRRLYKKWYEKCPNLKSRPQFHSGEQQEAQEFLQFILGLYGMNGQENHGAVSKEEFHYGVSKIPRPDTVWKFIYDRKDKTQSLVWNVPYHVLRNHNSSERTIENFMVRQDDIWNIAREYKKCQFNAIRTIHSLVKFADFMVFSLERAHPSRHTVHHFRVQIPETITDKKGKTLYLFGIICHEGERSDEGHYTAFHLSTMDSQWYYYDDMDLPIKKVGTWENVMSIRRISTHSVLLFYMKR